MEYIKLILVFSHCLNRNNLFPSVFPCQLLLNYLLFIFQNVVALFPFPCYRFSGVLGGRKYGCMCSIYHIYAHIYQFLCWSFLLVSQSLFPGSFSVHLLDVPLIKICWSLTLSVFIYQKMPISPHSWYSLCIHN